MNCWLPDCALGTGRGWRAQNMFHWCDMNMPLVPRGTCVISTVLVCGMLKCIPVWVSCGIDTNTYKIYIHDPSFPMSASLVPSLCTPPKAFCSCISLPAAIVPSPPVVKMRQTLETTLKTSWENKLPLKVIFLLTLDTALCFTSKNSCAATVIRIGSCWMYYSWGDIFTDLCLFVCVHQLSLQRWHCWVRSRLLRGRTWIWAAMPPPVIPLSRSAGGWATRSSTRLLSPWQRWDYTAHNRRKAEIYLSKQVDKKNVGKRHCAQWIIIGDHVGKIKENTGKGMFFL